jgi:thymidylate synthase (FAD)
MNDEQTGFDHVPTHYAQEDGRETIDAIRDSLGDRDFLAYCRGQVLRYRARVGKKTKGDDEKARFYEEMIDHLLYGRPDPRAARPTFQKYARQDERVHDYDRIPVLDHGYVQFIEDWGYGVSGVQEAAIIEAARQSTQGSFRGWERDQRLLKYLMENHHSGPFEFAGMTIEVQAPIMVFRQWHRHRTQSYNEMSARYEPLPDLDYVPDHTRVMIGAGSKSKQHAATSGAAELTPASAVVFVDSLEESYKVQQYKYAAALEWGVPKELARLFLTGGRYSRMRAQALLRNWLAFCTLRCDPHAQWEIRQFALTVANIISERFPRTWALFLGVEPRVRREFVAHRNGGN